MRKNYYNFLEKNNVETGKISGHKYWIVEFPLQEYNFGALNGYIHFKTRPTTERGYQGILTYVPVHGGITLAKPDGKKGMIYGFDTGHCDSEKYPRDSKKWIKKQIDLMLIGILRARMVEIPYLLTGYLSNFVERFDSLRIFHKWIRCIKAHFVQFVWNSDKTHENEFNFGMMINMLCGKI